MGQNDGKDEGTLVGQNVGAAEGSPVATPSTGTAVGVEDGSDVGTVDGPRVGLPEGAAVGDSVNMSRVPRPKSAPQPWPL